MFMNTSYSTVAQYISYIKPTSVSVPPKTPISLDLSIPRRTSYFRSAPRPRATQLPRTHPRPLPGRSTAATWGTQPKGLQARCTEARPAAWGPVEFEGARHGRPRALSACVGAGALVVIGLSLIGDTRALTRRGYRQNQVSRARTAWPATPKTEPDTATEDPTNPPTARP